MCVNRSNLCKMLLWLFCAVVGLPLFAQGVDGGDNAMGQTGGDNSISGENRFFTVNGVSFAMVLVEGGTFIMGDNDGEPDSPYEYNPAHSVTLDNYYIGETEVTQELWQAVMGVNPSFFSGNPLRPVERVSYEECILFIRKLSELAGVEFSLPTEAQWEYAARGGNKSNNYVYSGSNNADDVAWFSHNSANVTHAVKSKLPNELGIYDMIGNVLEWCSDWYGEDYYTLSPTKNPQGPSDGKYRVHRGGSCYYGETLSLCAKRYNATPKYANRLLGLRLVCNSAL